MKGKAMRIAFLAALALCVFSARAAVAPSNPIELTTEIGSVAGISGKISVDQKAQITKKAVSFTTQIVNSGAISYKSINIPADSLAAATAAIAEAVAAQDKDFKKKTQAVDISSFESDGKRVIMIRESGEKIFGSEFIQLDIDNAMTLVSLLKKAKEVQDWMSERAAALQK